MYLQRTVITFAIAMGLGITSMTRGQPEADVGARLIPFELPKQGYVSAAIYDAQGHLVRELLHAVPKGAGKHVMVWDSLDRDGHGLPAGEYTWKLLQTPGLKGKYAMSVGSSFPPGNDWSTACGPGTHSAPYGVAVDATGVYVAANTTENIETCILKMPPDGKQRLWSALHPRAWDGALSLAADGGELFMLGHVVASDSRIAPVQKRKQLLYVYDAATGKLAKRTLAGTAIGDMPVMIDVQWDQASDAADATDMDAHDGILVVAYEKRNALRWYDPEFGALLDTIEVPAPQGITVGANGTVYVSTGNRVVTLSRKNRVPAEVVTGLDKPGRLDVDHGSGELLVYLAGSQQIQRFSAQGKLLAIYGEKGGRKDGLYDAKAQRSFAGFADLCADGAGGFFVTESTTAPRRTAHFNREGAVIREWYGGQRWAPHATPEGDNPNVLWVGSHYGWIMRVLVDYDARTWTVHSCYKYTDLADGLFGDSFNEAGLFRVYRRNGTTYLALELLPTILKVDEKAWKLVPVTICRGVAHATPAIKSWAGKNKTFQWNDANGDGVPQQNEVTYYPDGIPSAYAPYIAPDFSCYTISEEKGARKVHKFAVTKWNDAGAPIYGTMPHGASFGTCPDRFKVNHFADTRWSAFFHQDPVSGNLYAAFNDWTRDWCDYADSFMHKWTPAGESKWTVGQRGTQPVWPGEIHLHLRGVAGCAHDCVIAIDVEGGWYMKHPGLGYVWDKDGLFVGGLLDNPDLAGIEKHWYQCGGECCHASVYTLPGGDILFFANWENEMRVYRVSGWSDWSRQSGTTRLDRPSTPRDGQGLTATYFDDAAMTKVRSVAVERQLDHRGEAKKPVAPAIRWSGTVRPEYGPAYNGQWTNRGSKQYFDGSAVGSRDNDASVTFRFRGKSIQVIGLTGPSYGFADISLDGKPQPRFDCFSAEPKAGVTFLSRGDLADGDHEVTVTVLGWYGRPRNPKSSDAWVFVDQFIVDGRPCDDAGYPYTFSAAADGRVELWIDRRPVIQEKSARTTVDTVAGSPIKLLRKAYPIQVNYSSGMANGEVRLFWANPVQERRVVPAQCLHPMTPGGYTIENARSPSVWATKSVNK